MAYELVLLLVNCLFDGNNPRHAYESHGLGGCGGTNSTDIWKNSASRSRGVDKSDIFGMFTPPSLNDKANFR
ncbi:predicted protein [Chaetomium globosum CBS 148.51]|uniref:Uncharacterized protein n=1 Tax=Chaetomium globosum (strain ATCC 6205 / CBS 148.51 / DSM 1962 / NBRC 6347 / NRRL 1970) TaxID=306901 RepID=Q2HFR1_CHAGB|nr:uncharacterized protein CHGG_00943 [Chaetomium globosum CBS 148.51]EAQ92708.1 predicted protein [Chaetomium globosum CBS 148.51]